MIGSRRAVVLLFVVLVGLVGPVARAGSTYRAGVVVVHDGTSPKAAQEVCIRIPRGGVKALALLDRTQLDLYSQSVEGYGRYLCWLDGDGYPPPGNCYGGLTDPFWIVYIQRKGTSTPTSFKSDGTTPIPGISSLVVRPGDVLYAEFAANDKDTGLQPPPEPRTFKEVCPAD